MVFLGKYFCCFRLVKRPYNLPVRAINIEISLAAYFFGLGYSFLGMLEICLRGS